MGYRPIVGAIVAAGLCFAGASSAETLIERGDYLVNAIMACDGCHTPRGPNGFVMEKRFSGGSQRFDMPSYLVRGANISPDADTGLGKWSDADIKRALVEGVRPDGVPLAPAMPFVFYKILTSRDLDAVVAYVRSAAPVRNEVQMPDYKAEMAVDLVPGADKPMPDADMSDPLKRGFYIATIAHCMECHARRPDGTQGYKDWYGKGGFTFRDVWGSAMASNITSHPTAGIGGWTDAEIRRVLLEGIGRDGRKLKPPMARHIYFKKMSETDLSALIAWLRTVPPIE